VYSLSSMRKKVRSHVYLLIRARVAIREVSEYRTRRRVSRAWQRCGPRSPIGMCPEPTVESLRSNLVALNSSSRKVLRVERPDVPVVD
jgi:hypothetical protein